MCKRSVECRARTRCTLHRCRITFVQSEAHSRTEMPFKIIPRAPKVISANVDAVTKGLEHNLRVVLNSLQPEKITLVAHTVLRNDDRLFVTVPISVDTS